MKPAVDQTSGTTTPEASAQAQHDGRPAQGEDAGESVGFLSRGRLRRRLRFLRRARELGYRDLGGLVFNLHRFGQRNDALVSAKLTTLAQIDSELRALEASLHERQPVTVLREAGVTACARCAAIHSSEDRFCPNCGLPMSRNVDLPIAGPANVGTQPTTEAPHATVHAVATTQHGGPAATRPATSSHPQAPAPPPAQPQAPARPHPASAPTPAAPAAGASPVAAPAAPDGAGAASPAPADGQVRADVEEPTEILRPPTVNP
jgi:hypothetical protein